MKFLSKKTYFLTVFINNTMNQWLVILLGALAVAAIVMGLASAYTNATAARLPERSEFIQLFIAGSLAGGALSWLITSGYLHGYSILTSIVSDVKTLAKDAVLKGGEEEVVAAASNVPVGDKSNSVSQMVGGFFNSMGINSSSFQELTVGMPSF